MISGTFNNQKVSILLDPCRSLITESTIVTFAAQQSGLTSIFRIFATKYFLCEFFPLCFTEHIQSQCRREIAKCFLSLAIKFSNLILFQFLLSFESSFKFIKHSIREHSKWFWRFHRPRSLHGHWNVARIVHRRRIHIVRVRLIILQIDSVEWKSCQQLVLCLLDLSSLSLHFELPLMLDLRRLRDVSIEHVLLSTPVSEAVAIG